MPQDVALPATNREGFFEIRLESIGGLGANVAGKILAEAGVLHVGLNASHFASYGSEKKGTPVKSFIRFAGGDRVIRNATPVERPHVLGVFHEALIRSNPGVLGGLYPDSVVVVNTRREPADLAEWMGLSSGRIGAVAALDIAVAAGSRVNMAMLGAVTRACSFLPPEAVVEAIRDSLGARYPRLLEANLQAFWRGYHEVRWVERRTEAGREDAPFTRPEPLWGYITACAGGAILQPGNTASKDMSASRQGFLPQFLRDKCIDCAQCDLVCPDFCFVWEMGRDKRGRPAMTLAGIDYQYCKGCLKCVEACPVDALVKIPETDGWAEGHRVKHDWQLQASHF
ncbi:MAG: 2-oxoacid:acceptor oxidoreductase family protein [Firmicutes bacterium]|nr:2-oxoacid:acceptor oxidoreductase family protein [Bacillota bacterium]